MIVLELFAGSRSIGKVAEAYGHTVISVDIKQFGNIDIVGDILEIPTQTFKDLKPDVIWASPPCTTFSVASIGTHWSKHKRPKTKEALKGLDILKKTIKIIKECNPKYWYIENPRGMMRKMPEMLGLPRQTVWYCQYGDKRAKPTDIWSNNFYSLFNPDGWLPLPECHNGNKHCHHEPAPRGSRTGTQGLKNNYQRSKIPEQLCSAIVNSIT
jgi:site-specific DNA-cytosine methylase